MTTTRTTPRGALAVIDLAVSVLGLIAGAILVATMLLVLAPTLATPPPAGLGAYAALPAVLTLGAWVLGLVLVVRGRRNGRATWFWPILGIVVALAGFYATLAVAAAVQA